MEYVYAAMLLHSAGKEITEEALKKVLKATGVDVNDARAKALIAALEDVNIDEAIKTAAVAPAAAPAAAPEAAGEAAAAAPAEEEEEEATEEEALAGLGSLFG